MTRCEKHDQLNCCRDEGAGQVGIDLDGDLTLGIGGGLAMDLSDGSLGLQIAPGITLDLDGN